MLVDVDVQYFWGAIILKRKVLRSYGDAKVVLLPAL